MKKQMTILAAAAILGAFAAGAIAAVPTLSVTGGLLYSVEYNLLARNWEPADTALNNAAATFAMTVATAGNPNLGTLTFANPWGTGNVNATISGTIKGYNVSLGTVAADWDLMSGNTSGAGASISKTMGSSSVALETSVSGAGVVNAGKVAVALGNASVYGGLVLDPSWNGLGYVGATSKLGAATLTARAGKLLGTAGSATAVYAKAEIAATPNLKLLAKVAIAPAAYAYSHIDSADTASGVDATEMEKLGWVAGQADRNNGKANIYAQANLTVNANVAPYGSFDYSANGDYVAKAGTSFKALYVNDAYVAFSGIGATNTTEFYAGLGKGIVSAFVGYKLTGTVGDTQAEVRVTQPIEWLTTWAAVGKAYASTTPYIKAGASASVSF